MGKINSKLSAANLASQCSAQSSLIPKLGARSFILMSRVNLDVIRNEHCASLGRCRRFFHLLRRSVEPFFNRLIFWTPRDYMVFTIYTDLSIL